MKPFKFPHNCLPVLLKRICSSRKSSLQEIKRSIFFCFVRPFCCSVLSVHIFSHRSILNLSNWTLQCIMGSYFVRSLPSSGREEDLNPGPPAYKSNTLTTRPCSPPTGNWSLCLLTKCGKIVE